MIEVIKIKNTISPLSFYQRELNLQTSGKQAGWIDGGLCPFHADQHRGSFKVNLDNGAFKCFSCNVKGGDIISFLQARRSLNFEDAVSSLCHDWGIRSTPEEAAKEFGKQYLLKGYRFEGLYQYSNPTFWVIRLKHPENGRKWIRPMHHDGCKFILKEPPFPNGRPLLCSPILGSSGSRPRILVEGEQKEAALNNLGIPSATFGSSDNVQRTNFQSSAGEEIILWPDNDKPGAGCMRIAAQKLLELKCKVSLIDVSKLSLPVGGDCIDWLKLHPDATAEDIYRLETIPIPTEVNDNTDKVMPPNSSLNTISNNKSVTWEEPIPFDDRPLPAWPSGIFPPPIENFITEVSRSTETPPELAAGMALAVLGTACQGKYRIRVKLDYCEPVNLWICVALPPATRKTSVFQFFQKPLVDWESAQRAAKADEIRDAELKRKNSEAIIASLRRRLGSTLVKKAEILQQIQDEEREMPIVPTVPQLFAQDITPEDLGRVMAENEECLAILCDEGGIFDLIAGRYSNNGIPNLDIFLQSHAGSAVRVNRAGRHKEPVFLERPALTMGITPQPEVLAGTTRCKDLRNRGLLARFLYLVPSSSFMGHRHLNTLPVSEAATLSYQKLITNILNQDAGIEPRPCRHIALSREAYKVWLTGARRIERQLEEETGTFALIQDWGGKLAGAIARIAGLLHVSRFAGDGPWEYAIGPDDINSAIKVAQILGAHALKAFDLMKADPNMQNARKVLNWLKRCPQSQFKLRDCHYALKKRFKKVEELEAALKILEDMNYIQSTSYETSQKGRPSRTYLANPQIWPTKTTEPAN